MTLGGGYMLPSREGHAIAAIGLGITMKTDGKSTHDAYSLFEYSMPAQDRRAAPAPAHPRGRVVHLPVRAARRHTWAARTSCWRRATTCTCRATWCTRSATRTTTSRGSSPWSRPPGSRATTRRSRRCRPGPKDIWLMKKIMEDFGIRAAVAARGPLAMRIAIIGAGVAGLATAKVLTQAGHDVVVFDKTPDVGGVWSRTRRYPGLTTQSPKAQYSLSDFPMPRDYPEWPSGEQVQAYLAGYADALRPRRASLRLRPRWSPRDPGRRRRLEPRDPGRRGRGGHRRVRPARRGQRRVLRARHPRLPRPGGVRGGRRRVLAGTELHDAEQARGKHVLVVGYGKSACDVTVPVSRGRRQHRRHRPAAAVEGAAEDQRQAQLQDAAADPDGRGAVPLPGAARRRRSSCTAPATACAGR